jgi:hypothetical protein
MAERHAEQQLIRGQRPLDIRGPVQASTVTVSEAEIAHRLRERHTLAAPVVRHHL